MALRDPLSVSAPVLPASGVPEAIQGAIGIGMQKEQLRRQKDQQKFALMTNLQQIQARGWERDQRVLDDMVNQYQEGVTDIMVERDGVLLPSDIRKISSQKEMIGQVVDKSLADKANYQDAFKYVRTHHKDLELDGVERELDKFYDQPIMQRGMFSFSPYYIHQN